MRNLDQYSSEIEPEIGGKCGLSGIYVLRLEEENYYVGMSSGNIEKRINSHFRGFGAEWTSLHNPVEVVETMVLSNFPKERLLEYEKYKTLEMMAEFGCESVRGAGWTETKADYQPIKR